MRVKKEDVYVIQNFGYSSLLITLKYLDVLDFFTDVKTAVCVLTKTLKIHLNSLVDSFWHSSLNHSELVSLWVLIFVRKKYQLLF